MRAHCRQMLVRGAFLTLVWAAQSCSFEPSLEPVRIIRGDPAATTWLDVTIEGVGLGDHNGRLVSARLGIPDRQAFADYRFTSKPLTLVVASESSSGGVPPSTPLMLRSSNDADCELFQKAWPTE